MIADYSSYLELLAAVYISMLLDVETLNKLWYPENYYDKIRDALKKELPDEEGKLNDSILSASKENASYRNKRMRCRAVFMLALTSILLALIGFESSFDRNQLCCNEEWYNAVLITYLLAVVVCFSFGRAFDNWNTTASTVLVVVAILVGLMFFQVSFPFSSSVIEYYPIVVVSLVTLPVLSEIFSLWLFSSVYSGYLRGYVKRVKNDYEKAMSALNSSEKKRMPREYRKLITKSIYNSNSQKTLSDICIQGYIDIRNNKLREISAYPNGFAIFFSWIGYSFIRLGRFICFWKKVERKEVAIQGSYSIFSSSGNNPNVILNFKREYDEYLLEKSKVKGLSIKQFCQQHGYDYKAMVTWIKQRNQNK